MGIWEGIADAEAPEYQGREELPEKQFFVMQTATKEDGGAAAQIREGKGQDPPDSTTYQFNIGLRAVGGAPANRKHKNGMLFFEAWVMPSDEGNDKNALLSGRLTGFLNAVFSSGIALDIKDDKARAQARWRHTAQVLAAAQAKRPEIIPEAYIDKNTGQQSVALFVAGCAVAALEDEARKLIVKTKTRNFKKRDGTAGSKIEIGTFEDFVPAHATNRGVVLWDMEGVAATPGVAASGKSF